MTNRVVVTGMGVMSAAGMELDNFWQAVQNGNSGVTPITAFDVSSFRTTIAAAIKDFPAKDYLDPKEILSTDKFSQFAIAATQKALDNASLKTNGVGNQIGVILGTCVGGIYSHEMACYDYFNSGHDFVNPMSIPISMHNANTSNVARLFGFQGNNYTISNACASSANAIGEAFRSIKHGYSKILVTGGSDATLSPVFLSMWNKLRAQTQQNNKPQKACKPFSKNRDGFVLGEGAGIFILESLSHARKRGARILAEIVGYGNSNDAYHLTSPNGDQQVKAANNALAEAKLNPEQIEYINAHGTGTQVNDKVETGTIKTVFGKHAKRIPISSTKPITGHTLGAAGAMELIVCILAMKHGVIPPTINYEVEDPECDLDYVPNQKREANINIAMSNSFAFGGGNAVLIVKNWTDSG